MTIKKPTAAAIYRLPPMIYGPTVSMGKTGKDKVDWGLLAHGIDKAWDTKGDGVLVGVADTGCPTHRDLKDAIVESRNFTRSYSDEDFNGHSTHLCGTLAARQNGYGVVGVAPECKLMIAKVLGDDATGDNLMVASGVRWLHQQGCRIINMSLGGSFNQPIADAIQDAVEDGVFVVCAAGNEGEAGQDTVGYPAKLPNTVAIASYNKQGVLSQYSSRGKEVHVAFPGENILSTWTHNSFRRISGTSMATPFCSGLVALLLSKQQALLAAGTPIDQPIETNEQLINRLRLAAIDQGPIGHDTGWGWGVVDTAKFLKATGEPSKVTPPDDTETSELRIGSLKIRYPVELDGKRGAFIYSP